MRCENCKDTLCPFRLTAGECRNYPNCMESFQYLNSTDFDGIKLAASDLVDAVERYMRQECLRSELAMKKEKLKALIHD